MTPPSSSAAAGSLAVVAYIQNDQTPVVYLYLDRLREWRKERPSVSQPPAPDGAVTG